MKHAAGIALALALAACGSGGGTDPPVGDPVAVVVVTLATRATTPTATTLHIAFTNEGTTKTRDFTLAADATFPTTLSVTAPGRTGELAVDVAAADASGQTVAHGHGVATLDPTAQVDLTVQLEPDDFVVNANAPASQVLARNPELAGRQLAVGPGGDAMVAWEVDCGQAATCNVFVRRFDGSGRPLATGKGGPSDDLVANQVVQLARDPAVAASPFGYLVTWSSAIGPGAEADVHATLFDPAGALLADEFAFSIDPNNEASAMPFALADSSFVVVWARARPDGATDILTRRLATNLTLSGTLLVSAAEPGNRTRPHGVGLSGGGFVIVWSHLDPSGAVNAHARVFAPDGSVVGPEYTFSSYLAGAAAGVRVVALPDGGFAMAWQAFDPTVPSLASGPLVVRIVDGKGNVTPEIRVADRTAATGPQAVPALAVRADGAIGIAWADAGADGDGSGLGVKFRLLRADGTPCGDAIVANTTTAGDQFEAAIATAGDAFLLGWTDGSKAAPDTSGNAIRGRYIYPSCP